MYFSLLNFAEEILFDSNTFVAKSKGAFQLSELSLQFKRSYFCSICSNEEKRTSSRKIKKERKKERKKEKHYFLSFFTINRERERHKVKYHFTCHNTSKNLCVVHVKYHVKKTQNLSNSSNIHRLTHCWHAW